MHTGDRLGRLATLLAASTIGLGAVTSASAASVCGPAGYAAPIATTTELSLTRSVAQYGSVIVATVRVSSGAGKPSGNVTIAVDGATYSVALNGGGLAQRQLPRYLAPQRTYAVTASYDGQGSCRASGPVTKYVTVVRGATAVRGLQAKADRSGAHVQVSGRVASYTGISPSGQVRLRLVRHGQVTQERTVVLHRGRFSAQLGRATNGTVRAVVLPNRAFRGSGDSTALRHVRTR